MKKIKKNDEVIVITGKDKGKKSKVLSVLPEKGKLFVEKVNVVKKHTKPGQGTPGGIIDKEKQIDVSNVMLICNYCKKPVKVTFEIVNDKKYRKCKSCGELIDKK
ncbi:MAG: 50S ribosomal protein L24 [Candidatus Margulisbacteria bacterium GWF2_35_9]|nr:MAG: 50S ribosomal protein L24 [Candidatus Margulisbacteria bacterium GWF2_35_9]